MVAASLTGLPYLGASFLAQSAFKETAMALLVLAFAVGLGELGRRAPSDEAQPHRRRAIAVALILFVVASVFVYSLPGLVWFALAVPDLARARARHRAACGSTWRRSAMPLAGHRRAILAVGIVLVAVGAFSAAQLSGFVGKVGDVQASAGQAQLAGLPGRGAGHLARGRLPRSSAATCPGAYLAVALGLLAAAIGAFGAIRRRDWGLVAMGASAVLVYAGARAFASIYVEAKALAVMAPLVVLAALYALFSPGVGVGRAG